MGTAAIPQCHTPKSLHPQTSCAGEGVAVLGGGQGAPRAAGGTLGPLER